MKPVYFYEYEKENLYRVGDIHDSLYTLAMEYAKERNLKGEEFLRKISDLQEASKNKLNNIVNDKCDSCNNSDLNLMMNWWFLHITK